MPCEYPPPRARTSRMIERNFSEMLPALADDAETAPYPAGVEAAVTLLATVPDAGTRPAASHPYRESAMPVEAPPRRHRYPRTCAACGCQPITDAPRELAGRPAVTTPPQTAAKAPRAPVVPMVTISAVHAPRKAREPASVGAWAVMCLI